MIMQLLLTSIMSALLGIIFLHMRDVVWVILFLLGNCKKLAVNKMARCCAFLHTQWYWLTSSVTVKSWWRIRVKVAAKKLEIQLSEKMNSIGSAPLLWRISMKVMKGKLVGKIPFVTRELPHTDSCSIQWTESIPKTNQYTTNYESDSLSLLSNISLCVEFPNKI